MSSLYGRVTTPSGFDFGPKKGSALTSRQSCVTQADVALGSSTDTLYIPPERQLTRRTLFAGLPLGQEIEAGSWKMELMAISPDASALFVASLSSIYCIPLDSRGIPYPGRGCNSYCSYNDLSYKRMVVIDDTNRHAETNGAGVDDVAADTHTLFQFSRMGRVLPNFGSGQRSADVRLSSMSRSLPPEVRTLPTRSADTTSDPTPTSQTQEVRRPLRSRERHMQRYEVEPGFTSISRRLEAEDLITGTHPRGQATASTHRIVRVAENALAAVDEVLGNGGRSHSPNRDDHGDDNMDEGDNNDLDHVDGHHEHQSVFRARRRRHWEGEGEGKEETEDRDSSQVGYLSDEDDEPVNTLSSRRNEDEERKERRRRRDVMSDEREELEEDDTDSDNEIWEYEMTGPETVVDTTERFPRHLYSLPVRTVGMRVRRVRRNSPASDHPGDGSIGSGRRPTVTSRNERDEDDSCDQESVLVPLGGIPRSSQERFFRQFDHYECHLPAPVFPSFDSNYLVLSMIEAGPLATTSHNHVLKWRFYPPKLAINRLAQQCHDQQTRENKRSASSSSSVGGGGGRDAEILDSIDGTLSRLAAWGESLNRGDGSGSLGESKTDEKDHVKKLWESVPETGDVEGDKAAADWAKSLRDSMDEPSAKQIGEESTQRGKKKKAETGEASSNDGSDALHRGRGSGGEGQRASEVSKNIRDSPVVRLVNSGYYKEGFMKYFSTQRYRSSSEVAFLLRAVELGVLPCPSMTLSMLSESYNADQLELNTIQKSLGLRTASFPSPSAITRLATGTLFGSDYLVATTMDGLARIFDITARDSFDFINDTPFLPTTVRLVSPIHIIARRPPDFSAWSITFCENKEGIANYYYSKLKEYNDHINSTDDNDSKNSSSSRNDSGADMKIRSAVKEMMTILDRAINLRTNHPLGQQHQIQEKEDEHQRKPRSLSVRSVGAKYWTSPYRGHILIGTNDHMVFAIDLRCPDSPFPLPLFNHRESNVPSVAYSSHGLLASAGIDGSVRVGLGPVPHQPHFMNPYTLPADHGTYMGSDEHMLKSLVPTPHSSRSWAASPLSASNFSGVSSYLPSDYLADKLSSSTWFLSDLFMDTSNLSSSVNTQPNHPLPLLNRYTAHKTLTQWPQRSRVVRRPWNGLPDEYNLSLRLQARLSAAAGQGMLLLHFRQDPIMPELSSDPHATIYQKQIEAEPQRHGKINGKVKYLTDKGGYRKARDVARDRQVQSTHSVRADFVQWLRWLVVAKHWDELMVLQDRLYHDTKTLNETIKNNHIIDSMNNGNNNDLNSRGCRTEMSRIDHPKYTPGTLVVDGMRISLPSLITLLSRPFRWHVPARPLAMAVVTRHASSLHSLLSSPHSNMSTYSRLLSISIFSHCRSLVLRPLPVQSSWLSLTQPHNDNQLLFDLSLCFHQWALFIHRYRYAFKIERSDYLYKDIDLVPRRKHPGPRKGLGDLYCGTSYLLLNTIATTIDKGHYSMNSVVRRALVRGMLLYNIHNKYGTKPEGATKQPNDNEVAAKADQEDGTTMDDDGSDIKGDTQKEEEAGNGGKGASVSEEDKYKPARMKVAPQGLTAEMADAAWLQTYSKDTKGGYIPLGVLGNGLVDTVVDLIDLLVVTKAITPIHVETKTDVWACSGKATKQMMTEWVNQLERTETEGKSNTSTSSSSTSSSSSSSSNASTTTTSSVPSPPSTSSSSTDKATAVLATHDRILNTLKDDVLKRVISNTPPTSTHQSADAIDKYPHLSLIIFLSAMVHVLLAVGYIDRFITKKTSHINRAFKFAYDVLTKDNKPGKQDRAKKVNFLEGKAEDDEYLWALKDDEDWMKIVILQMARHIFTIVKKHIGETKTHCSDHLSNKDVSSETASTVPSDADAANCPPAPAPPPHPIHPSTPSTLTRVQEDVYRLPSLSRSCQESVDGSSFKWYVGWLPTTHIETYTPMQLLTQRMDIPTAGDVALIDPIGAMSLPKKSYNTSRDTDPRCHDNANITTQDEVPTNVSLSTSSHAPLLNETPSTHPTVQLQCSVTATLGLLSQIQHKSLAVRNAIQSLNASLSQSNSPTLPSNERCCVGSKCLCVLNTMYSGCPSLRSIDDVALAVSQHFITAYSSMKSKLQSTSSTSPTLPSLHALLNRIHHTLDHIASRLSPRINPRSLTLMVSTPTPPISTITREVPLFNRTTPRHLLLTGDILPSGTLNPPYSSPSLFPYETATANNNYPSLLALSLIESNDGKRIARSDDDDVTTGHPLSNLDKGAIWQTKRNDVAHGALHSVYMTWHSHSHPLKDDIHNAEIDNFECLEPEEKIQPQDTSIVINDSVVTSSLLSLEQTKMDDQSSPTSSIPTNTVHSTLTPPDLATDKTTSPRAEHTPLPPLCHPAYVSPSPFTSSLDILSSVFNLLQPPKESSPSYTAIHNALFTPYVTSSPPHFSDPTPPAFFAETFRTLDESVAESAVQFPTQLVRNISMERAVDEWRGLEEVMNKHRKRVLENQANQRDLTAEELTELRELQGIIATIRSCLVYLRLYKMNLAKGFVRSLLARDTRDVMLQWYGREVLTQIITHRKKVPYRKGIPPPLPKVPTSFLLSRREKRRERNSESKKGPVTKRYDNGNDDDNDYDDDDDDDNDDGDGDYVGSKNKGLDYRLRTITDHPHSSSQPAPYPIIDERMEITRSITQDFQVDHTLQGRYVVGRQISEFADRMGLLLAVERHLDNLTSSLRTQLALSHQSRERVERDGQEGKASTSSAPSSSSSLLTRPSSTSTSSSSSSSSVSLSSSSSSSVSLSSSLSSSSSSLSSATSAGLSFIVPGGGRGGVSNASANDQDARDRNDNASDSDEVEGDHDDDDSVYHDPYPISAVDDDDDSSDNIYSLEEQDESGRDSGQHSDNGSERHDQEDTHDTPNHHGRLLESSLDHGAATLRSADVYDGLIQHRRDIPVPSDEMLEQYQFSTDDEAEREDEKESGERGRGAPSGHGGDRADGEGYEGSYDIGDGAVEDDWFDEVDDDDDDDDDDGDDVDDVDYDEDEDEDPREITERGVFGSAGISRGEREDYDGAGDEGEEDEKEEDGGNYDDNHGHDEDEKENANGSGNTPQDNAMMMTLAGLLGVSRNNMNDFLSQPLFSSILSQNNSLLQILQNAATLRQSPSTTDTQPTSVTTTPKQHPPRRSLLYPGPLPSIQFHRPPTSSSSSTSYHPSVFHPWLSSSSSQGNTPSTHKGRSASTTTNAQSLPQSVSTSSKSPRDTLTIPTEETRSSSSLYSEYGNRLISAPRRHHHTVTTSTENMNKNERMGHGNQEERKNKHRSGLVVAEEEEEATKVNKVKSMTTKRMKKGNKVVLEAFDFLKQGTNHQYPEIDSGDYLSTLSDNNFTPLYPSKSRLPPIKPSPSSISPSTYSSSPSSAPSSYPPSPSPLQRLTTLLSSYQFDLAKHGFLSIVTAITGMHAHELSKQEDKQSATPLINTPDHVVSPMITESTQTTHPSSLKPSNQPSDHGGSTLELSLLKQLESECDDINTTITLIYSTSLSPSLQSSPSTQNTSTDHNDSCLNHKASTEKTFTPWDVEAAYEGLRLYSVNTVIHTTRALMTSMSQVQSHDDALRLTSTILKLTLSFQLIMLILSGDVKMESMPVRQLGGKNVIEEECTSSTFHSHGFIDWTGLFTTALELATLSHQAKGKRMGERNSQCETNEGEGCAPMDGSSINKAMFIPIIDAFDPSDVIHARRFIHKQCITPQHTATSTSPVTEEAMNTPAPRKVSSLDHQACQCALNTLINYMSLSDPMFSSSPSHSSPPISLPPSHLFLSHLVHCLSTPTLCFPPSLPLNRMALRLLYAFITNVLAALIATTIDMTSLHSPLPSSSTSASSLSSSTHFIRSTAVLYNLTDEEIMKWEHTLSNAMNCDNNDSNNNNKTGSNYSRAIKMNQHRYDRISPQQLFDEAEGIYRSYCDTNPSNVQTIYLDQPQSYQSSIDLLSARDIIVKNSIASHVLLGISIANTTTDTIKLIDSIFNRIPSDETRGDYSVLLQPQTTNDDKQSIHESEGGQNNEETKRKSQHRQHQIKLLSAINSRYKIASHKQPVGSLGSSSMSINDKDVLENEERLTTSTLKLLLKLNEHGVESMNSLVERVGGLMCDPFDTIVSDSVKGIMKHNLFYKYYQRNLVLDSLKYLCGGYSTYSDDFPSMITPSTDTSSDTTTTTSSTSLSPPMASLSLNSTSSSSSTTSTTSSSTSPPRQSAHSDPSLNTPRPTYQPSYHRFDPSLSRYYSIIDSIDRVSLADLCRIGIHPDDDKLVSSIAVSSASPLHSTASTVATIPSPSTPPTSPTDSTPITRQIPIHDHHPLHSYLDSPNASLILATPSFSRPSALPTLNPNAFLVDTLCHLPVIPHLPPISSLPSPVLPNTSPSSPTSSTPSTPSTSSILSCHSSALTLLYTRTFDSLTSITAILDVLADYAHSLSSCGHNNDITKSPTKSDDEMTRNMGPMDEMRNASTSGNRTREMVALSQIEGMSIETAFRTLLRSKAFSHAPYYLFSYPLLHCNPVYYSSPSWTKIQLDSSSHDMTGTLSTSMSDNDICDVGDASDDVTGKRTLPHTETFLRGGNLYERGLPHTNPTALSSATSSALSSILEPSPSPQYAYISTIRPMTDSEAQLSTMVDPRKQFILLPRCSSLLDMSHWSSNSQVGNDIVHHTSCSRRDGEQGDVLPSRFTYQGELPREKRHGLPLEGSEVIMKARPLFTPPLSVMMPDPKAVHEQDRLCGDASYHQQPRDSQRNENDDEKGNPTSDQEIVSQDSDKTKEWNDVYSDTPFTDRSIADCLNNLDVVLSNIDKVMNYSCGAYRRDHVKEVAYFIKRQAYTQAGTNQKVRGKIVIHKVDNAKYERRRRRRIYALKREYEEERVWSGRSDEYKEMYIRRYTQETEARLRKRGKRGKRGKGDGNDGHNDNKTGHGSDVNDDNDNNNDNNDNDENERMSDSNILESSHRGPSDTSEVGASHVGTITPPTPRLLSQPQLSSKADTVLPSFVAQPAIKRAHGLPYTHQHPLEIQVNYGITDISSLYNWLSVGVDFTTTHLLGIKGQLYGASPQSLAVCKAMIRWVKQRMMLWNEKVADRIERQEGAKVMGARTRGEEKEGCQGEQEMTNRMDSLTPPSSSSVPMESSEYDDGDNDTNNKNSSDMSGGSVAKGVASQSSDNDNTMINTSEKDKTLDISKIDSPGEKTDSTNVLPSVTQSTQRNISLPSAAPTATLSPSDASSTSASPSPPLQSTHTSISMSSSIPCFITGYPDLLITTSKNNLYLSEIVMLPPRAIAINHVKTLSQAVETHQSNEGDCSNTSSSGSSGSTSSSDLEISDTSIGEHMSTPTTHDHSLAAAVEEECQGRALEVVGLQDPWRPLPSVTVETILQAMPMSTLPSTTSLIPEGHGDNNSDHSSLINNTINTIYPSISAQYTKLSQRSPYISTSDLSSTSPSSSPPSLAPSSLTSSVWSPDARLLRPASLPTRSDPLPSTQIEHVSITQFLPEVTVRPLDVALDCLNPAYTAYLASLPSNTHQSVADSLYPSLTPLVRALHVCPLPSQSAVLVAGSTCPMVAMYRIVRVLLPESIADLPDIRDTPISSSSLRNNHDETAREDKPLEHGNNISERGDDGLRLNLDFGSLFTSTRNGHPSGRGSQIDLNRSTLYPSSQSQLQSSLEYRDATSSSTSSSSSPQSSPLSLSSSSSSSSHSLRDNFKTSRDVDYIDIGALSNSPSMTRPQSFCSSARLGQRGLRYTYKLVYECSFACNFGRPPPPLKLSQRQGSLGSNGLASPTTIESIHTSEPTTLIINPSTECSTSVHTSSYVPQTGALADNSSYTHCTCLVDRVLTIAPPPTAAGRYSLVQKLHLDLIRREGSSSTSDNNTTNNASPNTSETTSDRMCNYCRSQEGVLEKVTSILPSHETKADHSLASSNHDGPDLHDYGLGTQAGGVQALVVVDVPQSVGDSRRRGSNITNHISRVYILDALGTLTCVELSRPSFGG